MVRRSSPEERRRSRSRRDRSRRPSRSRSPRHRRRRRDSEENSDGELLEKRAKKHYDDAPTAAGPSTEAGEVPVVMGCAPPPPPPPPPGEAPLKRVAGPRSGIFGYVREVVGLKPLRAGLADDTLDPHRLGLGDEQKFGRNNLSCTANGEEIRDVHSRGVRPDRAAEKDWPYRCKHGCQSFLQATQLSDHYMTVHSERIHASLLKPTNAERLQLAGDE